MKVSFVIPIYNVEQYLDRCVRSIANQTYRNIEIILVDDGSLDSCPLLCDKYAEEDTRIQVLHKVNGGLNSNLSGCFAEWINPFPTIICVSPINVPQT